MSICYFENPTAAFLTSFLGQLLRESASESMKRMEKEVV